MGGGALSYSEPDLGADGVVGRLDPRTRLLLALAVVVMAITLQTLPILVLALVLTLGLVWQARLPLAGLRHRLLHVEGFMLVLLVLLPFTTPGAPLFSLGPLAVTAEGVLRAATIALKVNIAVVATFALLGSLEPVRLGRAAAQLGVPMKLVHLFLLVVRFVGVFRAETNRLLEAMRARAFVARSNRHTWRTFGNLAGLMLVRSLDRAERVEEAMRCRGFTGRFPSIASEAPMHHDLALGALASLVLTGLVAADRLV